MTDNPRQVESPNPGKRASLADMVTVSDVPSFRESFPSVVIVRVLVLTALLAMMNHRYVSDMIDTWLDDPNWTHGFIIPLFSLYLLYMRRDELLSAVRKPNMLGLPMVIVGCLLQVAAYKVQNPWGCFLTMLFLAVGVVLYLGGWKFIKATWLPIMFLFFAIPLPDIYYLKLAYPLQRIAAYSSYAILRVFQVQIEVSESNLQVFTVNGEWRNLTVEEACSGMKMLWAFMALSVALAYLEDRPVWQRIVIVAMGIPIAVFCNVLRVTITCIMYIIGREELGQKFMHDFTGILMLIPAFLLLWLTGWILNHVFVEDDDEEDAPDAEDVLPGGEAS